MWLMGKCENGKMGKWENGKMRKWENAVKQQIKRISVL